MPREFLQDGLQFMRRSQKPDKKEFIKISQAVGVSTSPNPFLPSSSIPALSTRPEDSLSS